MKAIRRMHVYRKDTRNSHPPRWPSDVAFAKVPESELRAQDHLPEDVFRRQIERLNRFGASHCYGAYVDGRLASFAWLLPHDAMRRDVPYLLAGAPGEAELTGTETLPQHRGRWLYNYVGAGVFAAARESGIHTVFFKMLPKGKPSVPSFARVGAKHVGTMYYTFLPGLSSPLVWPRRFK